MMPAAKPVDEKGDRFFDSWRAPKSQAARAFIREVVADAEDYERTHSHRKRNRKATDQTTFEATVGAVLCDVTYAFLLNDGRPHVVPRSKRVLDRADRYKSPAIGGTLPDVLDLLEATGWLHQKMGYRNDFGRNQRTTIKPTAHLVERIEAHGLTLSDIGRSKGEEVLILKTVKGDYWHKGEYAQYTDTDETRRLREQVRTINEWIAQATIEFDEAVLGYDRPINPLDRTLRRYFSRGSFESGGRLFGGFWQRLSEDERLNGILINGEDVAEIDYGQVAARIMYGLAGMPVPEGDLYDIPDLTALNGKSYRKGVKLLFNSLTFVEGDPSRKPRKSKDKLPPNLTIQQIVELIKQAHPAIARYFGTAIGHELQNIESKVMVEVMLRLRDIGIIGLPIHDAIVVPYSSKDDAMMVMKSVFKDVVGVDATLSCTPSVGDTIVFDTIGNVPVSPTNGEACL